MIERARALRPRPLVVRLDGQQGRPLRQRPPRGTGRTTRPPTSSCSTSSRSATRAASAGSRRASRRTSRSWPSRAAARPRAPAPRRRTPARCSPPPTSTVDALFRQAGVIRADTLGELFDVAALLAGQPLPRGPPRRDRHQRRRAGHPRAPTPATADGLDASTRSARRASRPARGFCRAEAARRQPGRHDRVGASADDCGRAIARPRGRSGRRRGRRDLRPAARDPTPTTWPRAIARRRRAEDPRRPDRSRSS